MVFFYKKVNGFVFTFFSAIFVSQLFGLFPINAMSSNPKNLGFKWKSFRTIFALFIIFCCILTDILALQKQMSAGPLTPRNIASNVFLTSCWVQAVLFFQLSRQWKALVIRWVNTEKLFKSKDYELPKWQWPLKRRILVVTVFYFLFITLEHLAYQANTIVRVQYEVDFCNQTGFDRFELYSRDLIGYILKGLNLKFNYPLGILFEYLNFAYTFTWNFCNLFIILASVGIKFLFDTVNRRLGNMQGLFIREAVWAEIRIHYVRVSELLLVVNKRISSLLLVGCFNDTYFMLLQMMRLSE